MMLVIFLNKKQDLLLPSQKTFVKKHPAMRCNVFNVV